MGSCTKHFAVTEALLASVTRANHWLKDCYMRFWECLREKSCSLQNYSPCWGKTVSDGQEVFTRAKKLGSAWVPRAWQVSQSLRMLAVIQINCSHVDTLRQPADRFFWGLCALVGQHIQSLETIPRGTCMLMVNIQIVNMPTCLLI